jgi:hypothetical protein
MNLSILSEQDLQYTLEDVENGPGVNLIFYDETETEVEIPCQTTDIGFFIDPNTGMGVAGRQVEISCRISTVNDKNVIIEKDRKLKYYDTAGVEYKAIIKHVRPDRKLGIYNMLLEARN